MELYSSQKAERVSLPSITRIKLVGFSRLLKLNLFQPLKNAFFSFFTMHSPDSPKI